jgi:hypothetical protein
VTLAIPPTRAVLPRTTPAIRAFVPRDYTARWLALVAALVSIVAYVWFAVAGDTLLYLDSVAHLEISRRVVDSPTPGFGQLGSTWLPGPHVVSLPFIGFDYLYYSGLAGALAQMASFVVATVLLYKITYHLSGSKPAGLVAALVFMANPNVLYMQSTPMTELLLFAALAGMIYGVQRWIQTDNYRYLERAVLAGVVGALTRYEAWVMIAVMAGVVAFVAWRKFGFRYADGVAWYFVVATVFVGIGSWLLWCGLIFGNPLDFLNGTYSKPSIWVVVNELAIGNWWVSIQTYYYAMADNLSLPLLLVMVLGIGAVFVKCRSLQQALPALSTLVLVPFFVVALYSGQRPLHVEQLGQGFYNVRFGLLMVLPAAIFAGYLVGLLRHNLQRIATCAVAVATVSVALVCLAMPSSIATLQEPYGGRDFEGRVVPLQAGYALGQLYDDGIVLMQSFGNELVLPASHVDSGVNVYEGSNKGDLWQSSLADPAGHNVKWIVMRHAGLISQPDLVYERLGDSGTIRTGYELVYRNSEYLIYRRK